MGSSLRHAVWAGLLAVPLMHGTANACSTCKCGDPTITLLGSEKPFSGRLRSGLELLWRSETSGTADDPRQTTVDEQRRVLGLAISPNRDLTIGLQLPHVDKTLTRRNLERQDARGWGDADLSARLTVWRSGALSGRHLAGVSAGLRLPTAETLRASDGRALDIDAQPDAAAAAPNAGAWYAYHRFPWFVSLSAIHFRFANGQQGFAPGDATVASALAQYALHPRLALQAGLDWRSAGRNRFDDAVDPDSGGSLAMTRLGVAARLGMELIAGVSVQIPLIEELNGAQDEDPSVRISLAYDF